MNDFRAHNHNQMAGALVRLLLTSVDTSGGNEKDVCVLLESVCAGVLLVIAKPGGEQPVMDAIAGLAVRRAQDIRLRKHDQPEPPQ